MTNFDDILELVGSWGRYQVFHYVLIGLAGLAAGYLNLANVFLAGVPEHWCHVPELANLSLEAKRHLMTRKGHVVTDDSCKINDYNYTAVTVAYQQDPNVSLPNTTDFIRCTQWDYDMDLYGETIVTRWDLVCSQSWKRALASSMYMLGFLIGCVIFGTLADRAGRKLAWFVALIVMVISGVVAAFMPDYWSHILVRLVSGIAAAGTFTCGFVLIVESIGMSNRMIPGIFYQGWFAVGYMVLPGFAYALKDYVWLCLVLALIPVVFLPYWWILGESPRWQMSRHRLEAAEIEISRIGRMNRKKFTKDNILELERLRRKARHADEDTPVDVRKYNIVDLLRTPNMRKKSLNVFFNWFVNSLVYYGLSLSVADLAGSPYLNLFLSGLMEFPGFLLAVLALDRLGRRWPLAGMMVLGGVACLIIITIPGDEYKIVRTVLAMIGKLAISGSFSVIYVYTAELFPTVVRTIGVGSGSMNARIGGLLAPFVAELGDLAWKPLPMIIFGGSSVAAGLLALLLPETLNVTLPETLEQGEEFGKGKQSFFPKMSGNRQEKPATAAEQSV